MTKSNGTATRLGTFLDSHRPYWWPCGLLILVFYASASAQIACVNCTPDPTRGGGQPDLTDERLHQDVVPQSTLLRQELVTSNALRAPEKAQRAVQKAARAIQDNQSSVAERELSRALQLYPDYALALTLRALMNMAQKPSDATADLDHAIRVDPSYGLPYAMLASIYNDVERFDDALPLVLRAVHFLPSAWQVHFELARTLFGRRQTEEALKEVTGAIQRVASDQTASHEGRAALHFLRGRILIDQHEFAAAKLEFQMTVSEEPQGTFGQKSSQIIAKLESVANP
jgi:tetratricopeptide (TPR) repeat protein